MQRLEILSHYSDVETGISREFGRQASARVRTLITSWMNESGLEVKEDNLLNLRGIKNFQQPRYFVMGSHLDTVPNAGRFDGPLGVLMGIDQARRLTQKHSSWIHNLMVVGFSEEEGVRFKKPYLGSLAFCGKLEPGDLELADEHGLKLAQVLEECGKSCDGIKEQAMKREQLAGYLEVHIEQGPVLDKQGLPLGLVSGIAGQRRYSIKVKGAAGHAGTVPLALRQDALMGAAEMLLDIESTAAEYPQLVATVGRLEALPGSTNVIPGEVHFSLDIRHEDLTILNEVETRLKLSTQKIAAGRRLEIKWKMMTQINPVACDHGLSEVLSKSIEDCGFSLHPVMSGAGHDAVIMSSLTPVCMLFLGSKGGISHHPDEYTSVEDIASAIQVCDKFFDNLTAIN